MQPNSEKWSYLEKLSCKENSLKKNWFCFSQNHDTMQDVFKLVVYVLGPYTGKS